MSNARSAADTLAPDPYDAFFHAWPKQSDPKFAAKKQLWLAHGGWAARVSRAVMLYLLNCRGCINRRPLVRGKDNLFCSSGFYNATPAGDWM